MDTVMVLNILNVGSPINSVFRAGQKMISARVPKDKREQARALTNPLSESPDILEKRRAPCKGKGT